MFVPMEGMFGMGGGAGCAESQTEHVADPWPFPTASHQRCCQVGVPAAGQIWPQQLWKSSSRPSKNQQESGQPGRLAGHRKVQLCSVLLLSITKTHRDPEVMLEGLRSD